MTKATTDGPQPDPVQPPSDQPEPLEETHAPTIDQPLEAVPSREPERFPGSKEFRHAILSIRLLGILGTAFLVTAALSAVYVGGKSSEDLDFDHRWWLLPGCAVAIGLILLLMAYVRWSIAQREFVDRLDDEEKEELRRRLDEQLPETEKKLQRLIDANRALLNKYQEPVRAQARTSYTYAQAAITVGLVVLVAGATITVKAPDTATQVGIAALTAVGAALSGYIARTYLRVYEHAQQQLNFYFREPLVTSYLLTAERLVRELQGDRQQQAYGEMVSEIVRGVGSDLGPLVGDDLKRERPARKARLRRGSSDSE